jgi:hypothetical protein
VTLLDLILRATEGAVCRWRGHRWVPYMLQGHPDPLMRWAVRDYCSRCESNRLRFKAARDGPFTGEVLVCSAGDVARLAPGWKEGLYRARWGEYPRQRVLTAGPFPAEWRWGE